LGATGDVQILLSMLGLGDERRLAPLTGASVEK